MRFSLFGIPVRVQPMFWLVAVLLSSPGKLSAPELAASASWIVVLFVSILVHELGHAFTMRAFGRHPSIELWGMGGLTAWGAGPTVSHGARIAVSLAGPGAGLLLGFAVLLGSRWLPPAEGSFAHDVVRQALFINIGWGVLNLVPMLPLDGGHVLESLAAWVAGPRGRKAAHGVSLLLSVAVIAFALSRKELWIAFLGFWCLSISWRAFSEKPDARVELDPALVKGVEDGVHAIWMLLASGGAEEAERAAQAILDALPESAAHDPLRIPVLDALAWARIEQGNVAGAREAARAMRSGPSPLLEGRLLVAEGRVAEGLPRIEHELERRKDDFPALVASSVYVEQDRPDLALELLRSKRGVSLSSETHHSISAQLFHAERFELALEACRLSAERFPSPVHAYNAACCLARLGRIDEGVQWLGRAVESGFSDSGQLASDHDLDALRADPRFDSIVARAGGG